MKDHGEIRQKLKQAQFRHIKRMLDEYFSSDGEWPKDEVEALKRNYKEFFTDSPLHIIAKEFPDVAALMWVLEERPEQTFVPGGSMVGKLGGVMLWADTPEEAEKVRLIIEKLVESGNQSNPAPSAVSTPSDQIVVKKSLWQRLFG